MRSAASDLRSSPAAVAPARPIRVENADLQPPRREGGRGVAGDADPGDAVLLGEAEDDLEDPRQDVQVLVAVGVDEPEAGGEEALDLAAQLGFDLRGIDPAQGIADGEGAEARQEGAVRADEGGHLCRRRERALAHEGEVDSDVELRAVAQAVDRVVDGVARRDDAAGGDDPLVVGLQGSQGQAGVEADVVGRDDELSQWPGVGSLDGLGTGSASGRCRPAGRGGAGGASRGRASPARGGS